MAGPVNTETLLQERQKTHGEYAEHARCTQEIMRVLQAERNWSTLPDIMKESLHMFAHKMGRVLTGTPDVEDHWDDIAGYATLVAQRLRNPVVPMRLDEDIYQALAVAWNCSRQQAVDRYQHIVRQKQAEAREAREHAEAKRAAAMAVTVAEDEEQLSPEEQKAIVDAIAGKIGENVAQNIEESTSRRQVVTY